MKLIRVLEYDGHEEWLKNTLTLRAIRVSQRVGNGCWLRERYVVPEPKPVWWDEVVCPGVEPVDPTEEAVEAKALAEALAVQEEE